MGFLAYVMDTWNDTERLSSISEVPIVYEVLDVFPEELSGVPSERQVEFRIDLVLVAAPITMAPYRLAPPVM